MLNKLCKMKLEKIIELTKNNENPLNQHQIKVFLNKN
jgi:hypothetical protein